MSFGLVLVEVCDANAAWVPQLQELEEEFSGIAVLETACMSQCELCAQKPYVFLNGDIVEAETVDGLLERLRTEIRSLLSTYDTEI